MDFLDELLVGDFKRLPADVHSLVREHEHDIAIGYFLGRGRSPDEARKLASEVVKHMSE